MYLKPKGHKYKSQYYDYDYDDYERRILFDSAINPINKNKTTNTNHNYIFSPFIHWNTKIKSNFIFVQKPKRNGTYRKIPNKPIKPGNVIHTKAV